MDRFGLFFDCAVVHDAMHHRTFLRTKSPLTKNIKQKTARKNKKIIKTTGETNNDKK